MRQEEYLDEKGLIYPPRSYNLKNHMMDHYSDQARERIKKLEALKQEGFEPYPNDFKPTHLAGEIQKNYASHDREALEKHPVKVAVSGRMKGFRSFGKAAFIQLRDRSGDIQA